MTNMTDKRLKFLKCNSFYRMLKNDHPIKKMRRNRTVEKAHK